MKPFFVVKIMWNSPEEMEEDARRWRALLSSGRLRWLGSAGLDHGTENIDPQPDADYIHFGMEFWTHFGSQEEADIVQGNVQGRKVLTSYVDFILAEATKNV